MTIQHEIVDSRPPDTLPDVLDTIDQKVEKKLLGWRDGGQIKYGPEGLAILLRLEQARMVGGSIGLTVEIEV